MQRFNLIKRCSLLMLMLMLVNGSLVYGQSSGSSQRPASSPKILVDAEFLKAAEIAIAERDKFKSQSEAKDEVITAKDQQLAAERRQLQLQTQISADWKEAATARKDALKVDDKLLIQYDKRVAELQAERDSARRSNKVWGAAGLVLGAALAIFSNGRN
jgi:hypothetical protein